MVLPDCYLWHHIGRQCHCDGSLFGLDATPSQELWVMAKRMRSWIRVAEMSFLCKAAGLFLRDRVKSSVIWGRLKVELLLLHIERSQLRWFRHPVRMLPGCLTVGVFQTCSSAQRPLGRPRTGWRDHVSLLAWEHLSVSSQGNQKRWPGRGRSGPLYSMCCPHNLKSDEQKLMIGCYTSFFDHCQCSYYWR